MPKASSKASLDNTSNTTLSVLEVAHASDDLDYSLFTVGSYNYKLTNTVETNNGPMAIRMIPHNVRKESVLVKTGMSGVIHGTLLQNAYYARLAASSSYRRLWPVNLERAIGKATSSKVR